MNRPATLHSSLFIALLLTSSASPGIAQYVQQGSKLVGTGAVGTPFRGGSVAISADGKTAIVGGANDDSLRGAIWVFTRTAGGWNQEGGKLVGTGAAGAAAQGTAVAVSADGNTLIGGGYFDHSLTWNGNYGSVWAFTRNAGVWTQQGNKIFDSTINIYGGHGFSVSISADGNTALVGGEYCNSARIYTRSGGVWSNVGIVLQGTGEVGVADQGFAVALSGDGNTAIIGGWVDDATNGAAWVFTRTGDVWTQQGGKLVGTGAEGNANQGRAVAISADGNTAIVGGPQDSAYLGAAWVFTRTGGVWSQAGSKLVGTGTVGIARQGSSVAISADGNRVIVGGPEDDGGAGAAWAFTRNGGAWTQEGSKLAGSDVAGPAKQGSSVSLSADGGTAIVGGPNDDSHAGAAWIFTSPVTAVDEQDQAPDEYSLSSNYPNPFNPVTTIEYTLPERGQVSLIVANGLGEKVAELVNRVEGPGVKTVTFTAANLPSGVYAYRITAGSFSETRKMLLIK
jgi:hypothetical protein